MPPSPVYRSRYNLYCLICGEAIPQPANGRAKRRDSAYCKDAHRQKAYRDRKRQKKP